MNGPLTQFLKIFSKNQFILWYLDICSKNDVISFSRKRLCALGLRLRFELGIGLRLELAEIRLNTFSVKHPPGKCTRDFFICEIILIEGSTNNIMHVLKWCCVVVCSFVITSIMLTNTIIVIPKKKVIININGIVLKE